MLYFSIDKDKCVTCKKCVRDCPVGIIGFNEVPFIDGEKEGNCLKCQHCLAICPVGALSILSKKPENSISLKKDSFPDYNKLKNLIMGRRSVRYYKDENLDKSIIEDLLKCIYHAPTGANKMKLLITAIDNKDILKKFRELTYNKLRECIDKDSLPNRFHYFKSAVEKWENDKKDIIFRNAPHMLIITAQKDCPTPSDDAVIALTTFDLLAQSLNIGTLWDGFARWAINDIAPELKSFLNIPEDHVFGDVMLFGKPAVKYYRTVQKEPANVNIVGLS